MYWVVMEQISQVLYTEILWVKNRVKNWAKIVTSHFFLSIFKRDDTYVLYLRLQEDSFVQIV